MIMVQIMMKGNANQINGWRKVSPTHDLVHERGFILFPSNNTNLSLTP